MAHGTRSVAASEVVPEQASVVAVVRERVPGRVAPQVKDGPGTPDRRRCPSGGVARGSSNAGRRLGYFVVGAVSAAMRRMRRPQD